MPGDGCRERFAVIAMVSLLLGMVVISADAVYVDTMIVQSEQELQRDENGNYYMYVSPDDLYISPVSWTHDEDLTHLQYGYEAGGWSRTSTAWQGPATRRLSLPYMQQLYSGWLGNRSFLPIFNIYENHTSELDLSLRNQYTQFSVLVEQEFSLLVEPGEVYYGAFNLTGDTFYHLTVGNRQDDSAVVFLLMDPNGVFITEWGVSDGEVSVVPFNAKEEGMYTMLLMGNSANTGLLAVNLLLQQVQPVLLEPGAVAEGVLPGSKIVLESAGSSIVYEERAPTAITYKVMSNFTHPGLFRYSFNYPELIPELRSNFDPYIFINSEDIIDFGLPMWYLDAMGGMGDSYWYQSFRNGSFYFTVIGMDNVEYTLLNEIPDTPTLPLNKEFYLEMGGYSPRTKAFRLNLAQDSVMILNSSSESGGGFSWGVRTVDSDGFIRAVSLPKGTLPNSAHTYLPAGRYLILAEPSGSNSNGFYEFNIGPVVDDAGAVAVENGRPIGVRIDSKAAQIHRVNVTLLTEDNVTVYTHHAIIDGYGRRVTDWLSTLGNSRVGFGYIATPSNWTSQVLGLPTGYSLLTDVSSIVVVTPYAVRNNTGGLGNYYHDYTVDYDVQLDILWDDYYNGTHEMALTASGGAHNFTLGDPGDNDEVYALHITHPEGLWLNFSIYVEDTDDWSAIAYQNVDGKTQYLPWTSLGITFQGSSSGESSFQMGTIGSETTILFFIERDLVGEGVLAIEIMPFTMNTYQRPPPVMYMQPSVVPIDIMGQYGLFIAGGVGVVVIIAAVVYFAKRK